MNLLYLFYLFQTKKTVDIALNWSFLEPDVQQKSEWFKENNQRIAETLGKWLYIWAFKCINLALKSMEIITTLHSNKSYTDGKFVYEPYKRFQVCKDNAFVGGITELRMSIVFMKKLPML